jgi:hypothetical protein
LATRLRDVPENLDLVDIYNEAAEDRVKFYYDCFVNVPRRNSDEKKINNQQSIKQSSPKEILTAAKSIQKWKDHQIWPMIILFDIFLIAIVIYIYS